MVFASRGSEKNQKSSIRAPYDEYHEKIEKNPGSGCRCGPSTLRDFVSRGGGVDGGIRRLFSENFGTKIRFFFDRRRLFWKTTRIRLEKATFLRKKLNKKLLRFTRPHCDTRYFILLLVDFCANFAKNRLRSTYGSQDLKLIPDILYFVFL